MGWPMRHYQFAKCAGRLYTRDVYEPRYIMFEEYKDLFIDDLEIEFTKEF